MNHTVAMAIVKSVYPKATYVKFVNSEYLHHIRLYTNSYPYIRSLGVSDISEENAWIDAAKKI